LQDGRLLVRSLKNKKSGRELATGTAAMDALPASGMGTAMTEPWRLVRSTGKKLKQGELQLDIRLRAGAVEATLSQVLYPGSSVLRQWVTLRNTGGQPLPISEPLFMTVGCRQGADAEATNLLWMTGAESFPDSWMLRSARPVFNQAFAFDSFDPFPIVEGWGDGTEVKITRNGVNVWPESGWKHSRGREERLPFDFTVDITAGDKLAFIVGAAHNEKYDATKFDPTLTYEDGEEHRASHEFGEQGQAGWRYGILEHGRWSDLMYAPREGAYKPSSDMAYPFWPWIRSRQQHPDVQRDVVREWTATKSGPLRISGTACNVGNQNDYRVRGGSTSYAPWNALFDKVSGEGLVVGWDYFGHWRSKHLLKQDGEFASHLRLAGQHQLLGPGETMELPKAFIALFNDDLDNAGNALLDWQYEYLWDYTRETLLPATAMLGYWYKESSWLKPGDYGTHDIPSHYRKIFGLADTMRYVGARTYQRDYGWWDRQGDWNGPDFRSSGKYLNKCGINQLIYCFPYHPSPESPIAKAHPEWIVGGNTLDMSLPDVIDYSKQLLDGFVKKWGDFTWRTDSMPMNPRGRDESVLLGQDRGLREIIRHFLDKHPGSAFQSCNCGGNLIGWEHLRLSSWTQFSDGGIGIQGNYYTTLLFPPDKLMDNGDTWKPEEYEKARWRGVLCMAIMSTGDTTDPEKLDGIRELFDIYRYFHKKGVAGRWSRVYRPKVQGDDPIIYFQRVSRDGLRSVIIPKRRAPGVVTIWPKGLHPKARYHVTFQESVQEQKRTGADLMEHGITVQRLAAGELIYLNLQLHPGRKPDGVAVLAPGPATKQWGENMGYSGLELQWMAAPARQWVSYYEILRDGRVLDKVSIGTFYFDHSLGADGAAEYAVRTVDGAGNRSSPVLTRGGSVPRSRIVNDTSDEVRYGGNWTTETGVHRAHRGSLTRSNETGALAEFTFEGSGVEWVIKLTEKGGVATIRIDDLPPEEIDTYSADEIWGICIHRKELPEGLHTVRVEVTGRHNEFSKGTDVTIDGWRIRGSGAGRKRHESDRDENGSG
jgi:hypothetical protein